MTSGEVETGVGRSFRARRLLTALAVLFQVGVATWVVVGTRDSWRAWTFFAYYAGLIVLIPTLFGYLSDGALSPLRRAGLALGLSMHPLTFYYGLYKSLWWWDIVAHFVSASLLAAGGYAVAVALRDYTPIRAFDGPRIHVWVFLLMVVGGVAWEVYELIEAYLTVYGPEDTIKDLVVNLIAWAVVARFHEPILGNVPRGLGRWFRGEGYDHADRPPKLAGDSEASRRNG